MHVHRQVSVAGEAGGRHNVAELDVAEFEAKSTTIHTRTSLQEGSITASANHITTS